MSALLRDDDPRRALDLWKGLVSGYYSLVDYFDKLVISSCTELAVRAL